jgi:16S rRNA G966 N2-methylase RsmD
MLRVVSGLARGIILDDVNKDTTRPITSRIKTSLFDKLQFFIADEKIADLY